MSYLTLFRKQIFKVGLPLWVFVNEHPIGIMRGKEVTIEMPDGSYDISIRILFQIWKYRFYIGGSEHIYLKEDEHKRLQVKDKERLWNILFDIDLVFWLVRFFYTFPSPWDTIYEIVSNGFFVIWILRMWMIRERYFKIE